MDRGYESEIPARARELIRSSVRSIEELETLLQLRADAARKWTAEQLALELRLSERTVVAALQRLVLSKLVVQVGEASPLRYQYAPRDAGRAAAIDEVADAYQRSRLEVLTLISSGAIERLRREVPKIFRHRGRRRGDKDES